MSTGTTTDTTDTTDTATDNLSCPDSPTTKED